MTNSRKASIVVTGAIALLFAGPAVAGDVADLQAHKAALVQELEAIDAELAAQGVDVEPRNMNIVPAGAMAPTPGGSDGLTGYAGLFVDAEQIHGFRGSDTQSPRVVPSGGGVIGANLPIGGGWNAGIDGFGGATGQDDGRYFDAWGGGSVHLFWRDVDYAIGVFGTGAALMGSGRDSASVVAGGVDTAILLSAEHDRLPGRLSFPRLGHSRDHFVQRRALARHGVPSSEPLVPR